MKQLIALLLICAFLTGCTSSAIVSDTSSASSELLTQDSTTEFSDLSSPELLNYIESSTYIGLIDQLNNEHYFVENIEAVFISKEYIEESSYNSKSNIYFGFTLAELDEVFHGSRYVFTLGEDGQTTVKEFEKYDDTYDQVLKNVLIGSGVILVCVTVSVVTGGIGASAVSLVFATSAKSAAIASLSGGVISGVSAGVVEGIQTKDFDAALKAAAVAGSDGFKWGAIGGSIEGGISGLATLKALKGATLNGLSLDDAAKIQMETKYPVDVIKNFQTIEQYEICKKAGLTPQTINGKVALIRDIDLDYIDENGLTNLQRMNKGISPLDSTGTPYEIHHIGQKTDSTLAILTRTEHRQAGNHKIWHYLGNDTDNPSTATNWNSIRESFWKTTAKSLSQ